MFYREPKILGISMATRKNRRRLVVITYACLFPVAIGLVGKPWGPVMLGPWYWTFIVFSSVSTGTFGAVVRQFTFPVRRSTLLQGLELEGRNPAMMDEDPEPDERDTKIRDHAYFIAFRIIAAGMILAWISLSLITRPDFPAHSLSVIARSVNAFLMPFVILALTLPQAIILWQQPDMITD